MLAPASNEKELFLETWFIQIPSEVLFNFLG